MTARLFDDPALARVIDRQMRNWEIGRTQRTVEDPQHTRDVADFVAVSRSVGCGGGDLGRALADRLGWPVFDKQILEAMAADDAIRRHLYESMDERDLNWFEDALRCFVHGAHTRNDYFHRLTATVLSLARQGRAVFIGRAADLLLPRDRGLRLRVVAPLSQRVQNVARRLQIGDSAAGDEIQRIDHDREAFVKNHFEVDVRDPARYDLVINLGVWSEAQAVDLILEAMRLRGMLPK